MNKIYKYIMHGTSAMGVGLLSLFATSCSNDEPTFPTEPGTITFTAPTEIETPSSRVRYTQNEDYGIKVKWEKYDMVYFVDTNDKQLAEFTIKSEPTTKAIFTCTKVADDADLSNVKGVFRYKPSGKGYVQTANGSDIDGTIGTGHLKFANAIESDQINGDLTRLNQTLIFHNTTAIFRVKLTAPVTLESGTKLTIKGGSGWGEKDNGIDLIFNFDKGVTVPQNKPLIAYIAVPAGQVNNKVQGVVKYMLGFILTPASGNSKYHSYKVLSRTYDAGKEYTADLTTGLVRSYQTYFDDKGYEYVDLGIGTLWATMNIGAENIVGDKSFGSYFQWGTTEPYNPLSDNANENSKKLSTLNNFLKANESVLPTDKDNDVAFKEWGDNWRIPTEAECQALISNGKLKWEWDAVINCFIVTSTEKQNAVLFLPAAGYYQGKNRINNGADYWSSSIATGSGSGNESCCMQISNDNSSSTDNCIKEDKAYPRNYACPIRPVYVGPKPSDN